MGRGRSSAFVFAAAYIVLIVGLFLALGGTAYAQAPSSAADQYGTSASDQYGTKVAGITVSSSSGGGSADTQAAALPNTGISLAATLALSGVLVALGIALRRRERRRD